LVIAIRSGFAARGSSGRQRRLARIVPVRSRRWRRSGRRRIGYRLLRTRTPAGSPKHKLGPQHPWTKDSARVTADALDALGRADEAKALRVRYGVEAKAS
jgi:hypothetical protein